MWLALSFLLYPAVFGQFYPFILLSQAVLNSSPTLAFMESRKSFILFIIYLFYFCLVLGLHCCVGLSLVVASGGYSLVALCGLSLLWLLLLQSMAWSRVRGLQ